MWSKSDDGSAANAVIATGHPSDKYTVVDGNSLGISLDIKVDGGLYCCVYGEIGTLLKSELCVYVYGKSTS